LKEKIDRLSRGIFAFNPPKLEVESENLYITVEMGKSFHGSFRVSNSNDQVMKGMVYSDNSLLALQNAKGDARLELAFISHGELTVNFTFDAKYLDAGTDVKGQISIISEFGERAIPYGVKVLPPSCKTSMGELKDMFMFTNIARKEPDEAISIFVHEDFRRVVKYYNRELLALYDTLVRNQNISFAIEEFLIAIHKKNKVVLSVGKDSYQYDLAPYSFTEKVVIKKDTWGYVEADIRVDSDFMEVDRPRITSDDFINGTYELTVLIRMERLQTGLHYGTVTIESVHQSIPVSFACRCIRPKDRDRQADRRKRVRINQLMENYLNYRTGKVSLQEYIRNAERELALLKSTRNDFLLDKLYGIHLLHMGNKQSMANNMLNTIDMDRDSCTIVEHAAYQYVKMLVNRQAPEDKVLEEVRQGLYQKNDENDFLLFFIMLNLDERYEKDVLKKYNDIKDYVLDGCLSPVILYEAAVLVSNKPDLIKELGPFEIKLLCFMTRRKMFEKGISLVLSFHATKLKDYDGKVHYILCRYYEAFPIKETLFAIIVLLIRGNKSSSKYFDWYHKAMKERLRISQLPAYYLESAELLRIERPDPSVYAFFCGNPSNTNKRVDYLYYTLIRNREQELIAGYRDEIYKYALSQLESKRIDTLLDVVYDEMLKDGDFLNEGLKYLPDVMFKHEITVYNDKVKKVLVVHKELESGETYVLKNHKAYIQIFTEDAEIFLIDGQNNYYSKTIEYSVEKFLVPEMYVGQCYNEGCINDGMIIWMNDKNGSYYNLDKVTSKVRERLVGIGGIRKDYRQECLKDLIFYYYDNFENTMIAQHLENIDFLYLNRKDRNRLIELLILRERYDEVVVLVERFGIEGMDVKRIQRFCMHYLQNKEDLDRGQPDKRDKKADDGRHGFALMTYMCHKAYKHNQATKEVVAYLLKHYEGPINDMHGIWKLAKEYDMDTYVLEEKLLTMALFGDNNFNGISRVFSSYYRSGTDKRLIRAFLSYYSYRYVVSGRVLDDGFFDALLNELGFEENEIGVLAYLKYLSEKDMLSEKEAAYAAYHMGELGKKGVELSFFKAFARHMRLPSHMCDKYYVEYYTEPSYIVKIHFAYGEDDELTVEPMKNACYGIFTHKFVIFKDERVHYYITENAFGKDEITQKGSVSVDHEAHYEGELFYNKINQIYFTKDMNDDATMIKDIEDYIRLRYKVRHLFKAIG